MARTRIVAALFLCLAGGTLALILLSKHYGVPLFGEAVLAACGVGGGCDIVAQSRYSSFLGLPLAAWGLFFYGSLFVLLTPLASGKKEEGADPGLSLAFFLVAAALIIDLVLLGIQAFAIKAFCEFCGGTYVVNLLLLASLWPFKQAGQAMNFLFTPQARRGLSAWVIGSLFVALSAVALNSALNDRNALAGNSILGTPTLLQPPGKIEKGSLEEQLASAQAEAKKWKETLDDEKKLQTYLNQKARDDFNNTAVTTLDLARSPSKGSKNGPMTVVTFSDFMCPFCRNLALGLKDYLPTSGDRIKIQYKHFPLDTSCNPRIGQSLHPGSCELSLAGICAEESGRFWEFHDKVFERTWDKATREDALRIGASAGLDGAKLGTCMDAAATRGLLTKEIEEGWRVGVASTPTIFINGRKLQSAGLFFLAIEEERKRLNLPPINAPAVPKDK